MAPRPRRWQEEVEGWEKALDWRPGCHQRPNHRPEARFGAEPAAPPRSGNGSAYISSQRRPRMHPLPQQRGHPFTSGLMLRYWKDIETLIGNYWKAGLQGQIDALEKRILRWSVTTKWKLSYVPFLKTCESNFCCFSMILSSCHNMRHKNLIQSNFVLKYTLSVFREGRRGEESVTFINEEIE